MDIFLNCEVNSNKITLTRPYFYTPFYGIVNADLILNNCPNE